ncbi:MAG: hypothetical protein EB120_00870 [Proteobacteria bacterium]|nr:hypothetical protein [Pseudomonadota bacterium]
MERKKLPNSLEDEELISLLNQEKDDNELILNEEDELLSFISAFELKPGPTKVRTRLVYLVYKKWGGKLDRYTFSSRMGLFFEMVEAVRGSHICLNESSLHIYKKGIILKKVKKRDKLKIKTEMLRFQKFLDDCNIKKGEEWVLAQHLYLKYHYYCLKKGIRKMNKENFHRFLKAHFISKQQKDKIWVSIAPSKKKNEKKEQESGGEVPSSSTPLEHKK